MKSTEISNNEQAAYLFNVDLLVQGPSNALAFERLIGLLNRCGFDDYRIQSGVELGQLIEALETLETKKAVAANNAASQQSTKADINPPIQPSAPIHPASASTTQADASLKLVTERIQASIEDKRLIRLKINKGFGVKLNIPCRIINFDIPTQMLTVYHVDEKQVYTFSLNEIDDFVI